MGTSSSVLDSSFCRFQTHQSQAFCFQRSLQRNPLEEIFSPPVGRHTAAIKQSSSFARASKKGSLDE